MSDDKDLDKDLENDFDDEDEDEIVVLQGENGEEIEFYHIATIDYQEKWYILLQPVEAVDDITEDDVVIFEMTEGEEGDNLIPVEDDEILDAVYEIFLKELEAAGIEDGCDCGDDDCGCGHDHGKKD